MRIIMTMKQIKLKLLIILLLGFAVNGCAVDSLLIDKPEPLTGSTIAAGLKEALRVGIQRTVSETSKRGGYLENPLLHIALPEEFDNLAKGLRAIGFGNIIDSFETGMNRAAEKAASEATPVFLDAIKSMTIADAYGIWQGPPTAATDFFRQRSSDELRQRFQPIINDSMRQIGIYRLYQDVLDSYNQIPFAIPIAFDLSDYITEQSLDGLFTVLGQQEAKIRQDPLARTTELLRDVFGRTEV